MKATADPQVETDRVIVTEWRFAPGAETGHHVHAYEFRFLEIELKWWFPETLQLRRR